MPATAASPDTHHAHPDAHVATAPKPVLAGLRLLVVEDMALVADMIREELVQAGAEVVGPVARLAAAEKAAQTEQLDGALLDVNLAGVWSFPVADVLRRRNIPFLLLTGYNVGTAWPIDMQTAPRLAKPFVPDELIRAVANAFRKR